ncbi:MAG: hypothetical protein PHS59_02700 [Paludibacter sp.]|nr:hypothetical protein [Paludibacter sp.]
MKRNILLILFLSLIISEQINANVHDSISSVYKNGEFVSYCKINVKASDNIANAVINDFNAQLESDLHSLFGWALKGLKFQGEKDELMSFKFKSGTFYKDSRILKCVVDVIVPHIITVPDIMVDFKLTKTKYPSTQNVFLVDLVCSNTFLKTLKGNFEIVSLNNECYYTMEIHLSFGRFFDFFITESKYKQIAEWRLKKFITNLKEEAERREKKIHTQNGL